MFNAYCSAQVEFGNIVWYVDPSTKNIIYAIDGADNREFYSYAALKDGFIGIPEHLTHYDIWFTNAYPFLQIKGLTTLKNASKESFESKAQEIEEKFNKWSKSIFAGRISTNGNKLNCFSLESHPEDFRTCAMFFMNKGLVFADTEVYWNEELQGKVTELLDLQKGHSKLGSKVLFGQEDLGFKENDETLDLINIYVNSQDPNQRQYAGEQLYEKYYKLVYGVWRKWLKKLGLSSESSKSEDMLQEAMLELLNSFKKYNPTKSRLSTFIFTNVDGIIQNLLNTDRNKVDKIMKDANPQSQDSEHGAGDDKGLNLNNFEQTVEPGVEDIANKEFMSKLLNKLPEKVKIILEKYFYEDKTLEQIGEELGISKERVRQIVEVGLAKIRENPEIKNLGIEIKKDEPKLKELSPEELSSLQPNMQIESIKIAMLFNEQI